MPSPTFAHSSRRVKRRWLIDEVILVRLARRCRYKNPRAATDPAARPFPLHAAGTGQCVTLPPSVTTPPEPWALRLINGRCLYRIAHFGTCRVAGVPICCRRAASLMLDPRENSSSARRTHSSTHSRGSRCNRGILEDRDSCPKAPTNDTRVMAVGCPRKREKAVLGKTFRV